MKRDYTIFLWLLKLGGLLNLYLMVRTRAHLTGADAYSVLPAEIFFAVSAYRCFFPVRYEHNVVLHDTAFSSIFLTRLFATFSEIAYIFLLSHVLRSLNRDYAEWIVILSWFMVAQVLVGECVCWAAILTEHLELYYYEELIWALMLAVNAIVSAYLYLAAGTLAGREVLLELNIIFALVYLPWQVIHLKTLRASAQRHRATTGACSSSESIHFATGLKRAMRLKVRRTDADAWGGVVGLTWMTGYWATLLPLWVYYIVIVLCPRP